ncbi:hypothetical protein SG34_023170 [Thalassomonas viridans]|uniref:SSU ribosomal protein S2p (SAe) n=1 Tax=Thalassomonas viridans TaxID=137584 RepID=A0AAF0C8I2_9GAMM|nr:hypothetical protein [Thalassomonas viridans]WDE04215.1 hypothetical protein SG34_023170 [Thalassomonas viridans]
MNAATAIPDDYAIHIVEKAMDVNQLIMIMYNNPDTIVYEHFRAVNQHLFPNNENNPLVCPGQVVLLSPATSSQCTLEEQAFYEVAKAVDLALLKLSTQERELLAKRYDFLASVASYNGLLLGVSNTSWNAHVRQVEGILKDIEGAYTASYNAHGNLNNNIFLERRRTHFARLNDALLRFGQPELGNRIKTGDIRSNLGLSTKSTIHQWKKLSGPAETIPNFARNYETVSKMASNLKRVGYLGIALTGIEAGVNIDKACTVGSEFACNHAKHKETGKAVGSIVGGAALGWGASYIGCNILFGLPSSGTSFFWCSLITGTTGGYLGGIGGSLGGQWAGNKVYSVKLLH